jgi:hypothetical protein
MFTVYDIDNEQYLKVENMMALHCMPERIK